MIWETVVGERDADFNKVSTGGKSAIVEQISTNHPLYSQIMSYYNSIAASVQRHSKVPSFLAKSVGKAQNIELEWNGEAYTATLTDTNGVLSDYAFSANASGIRFSVSGNTLTITRTMRRVIPSPLQPKREIRSGAVSSLGRTACTARTGSCKIPSPMRRR